MTFKDIEFLFTIFIIIMILLLPLISKLESNFKKFKGKYDDKSK